MEETVRRHICFYGQVQGVGFRYTAVHLAQPLGLTGWVRNVDDFVEMEVQGKESAIERLLDGLHNQTWIRIDRMETTDMKLQKERRFTMEW